MRGFSCVVFVKLKVSYYFWIWLTGWDNDSWTRININYDHPQKHPIIEFPSGPDLVKNSTQPKRNLRRKRCVSYHQCHNHWIFPEEHHFKDAEKRSCNDCVRWITKWVGNCLIRKSLRWSWYVAGSNQFVFHTNKVTVSLTNYNNYIIITRVSFMYPINA